MSKDEIKQRIKELKTEQKNCRGTKGEVYSRVVGYLRPVQNWNKGKKAEYSMRKTFNVENPKRPCGC